MPFRVMAATAGVLRRAEGGSRVRSLSGEKHALSESRLPHGRRHDGGARSDRARSRSGWILEREKIDVTLRGAHRPNAPDRSCVPRSRGALRWIVRSAHGDDKKAQE